VGCESTHLTGLRVARFLEHNGHQLVESPDEADYIVVNTCAFVSSQRKQVVERLESFARSAPRAEIVIMGCARDIAPGILEGHRTTLKCGLDDLYRLNQLFNRKTPIENTCHYQWSNLFGRVIVPVGRGCVNNCSYCSVKKSTGPARSRAVEAVLDDIRSAVAEGHDRFLLAADDLGSYGQDIRSSLAELLKAVDSLPETFTVLLSNIHPRWFLQYQERIKEFLASPHASKWLFLPIQSANQDVLDAMNRNHSITAVADALEDLSGDVPSVRLYYDIIVGFPTESEESFNDTLKFVMRFPPSCLTISPFSAEKGTPAAELTPLAPEIVRSRVKWLKTIYGHAVKHNDRVSEGNWGEE
jgi:MiaB/RimO family radical SAM methylthiotransferase